MPSPVGRHMLPQRVTKKIGLRLGGGWFVVVGSTPIGSVYRLGDAWSTVSRGTHPALGARVHSPQGPLNWHSTRAQPARERVRTGSSTCVGQDRKTRPSHYPDTSNTHTPRTPLGYPRLPVLHRIPATPHKEGVWVEIQKGLGGDMGVPPKPSGFGGTITLNTPNPPQEEDWVGVSGGVLLSHTLPCAVPSALRGLASGFGMRPGVSLTL